MHNHISNPMINFYFNEKYYFPMFHEHQNTKLNHFSPISKAVNFWVLQWSLLTGLI